MNAREIKLVVLALLLTAAAGSGYWFYLREDTQNPAEQDKGNKAVKIPPATSIRLSLLDQEDGTGDGVNIFNYRKPQLTEAPAPEQPVLTAIAPPPPPPVLQPPTTAPQPARPAEPQVTPLPLTYSGFAKDDNNEMIAFLETTAQGGAAAGHYNLREDDFFMGRIRVLKITDTAVEVEDWERPEAQRTKQTIQISNTLIKK